MNTVNRFKFVVSKLNSYNIYSSEFSYFGVFKSQQGVRVTSELPWGR
jgi:hypothetical protein